MIPLLEVYDGSFDDNRFVGTCRFSLRHGAISSTFSYADSWLSDASCAYAIDSSLPLTPGLFHCFGLPGALRDSAPDRWGRTLIERDRRDEALQKNAPVRQLDEVDFLTGVLDLTREGSLRFCEPGKVFLAENSAIPPLLSLPRLVRASWEVAKDEAGHKEIKELLDAGSGSLGGARPKASVMDGSRLLLAKFSHPDDAWDVMAWEKTALDLARAAGIAVPWTKLVRIGNESVLLLERFDRSQSQRDGRRIPYQSAMTVLESDDGQRRDYAELAEAAVLLVEDSRKESRELFTRVAFSIAVANVDDHLRNWAFIREKGRWMLSPLFDVNPCPYANSQRVTTIAGEMQTREALGLKDLAAYVGLDFAEATKIVGSVLAATENWKDIARKNGCSEQEIKLFQPVFSQKTSELRMVF